MPPTGVTTPEQAIAQYALGLEAEYIGQLYVLIEALADRVTYLFASIERAEGADWSSIEIQLAESDESPSASWTRARISRHVLNAHRELSAAVGQILEHAPRRAAAQEVHGKVAALVSAHGFLSGKPTSIITAQQLTEVRRKLWDIADELSLVCGRNQTIKGQRYVKRRKGNDALRLRESSLDGGRPREGVSLRLLFSLSRMREAREMNDMILYAAAEIVSRNLDARPGQSQEKRLKAEANRLRMVWKRWHKLRAEPASSCT